jgi:cysteine desulfurase
MTHGSLRVSLGRETTADDVEYFLDELPAIVEQVRAMTRREAGSA